jgi:hypothetical protein
MGKYDCVVQNHLTLAFPIKSAADRKALEPTLSSLMSDVFKAADAIGTVHYARFVILSDKTLLFLADFDDELEKLLQDLAQHLGPVLDAILEHVDNPPHTPVANNRDAFVRWAAGHQINPIATYTAYPGATVQKIKSQAATGGHTANASSSQQLPFMVILPIKSRVSALAVELLLKGREQKLTEASSRIRTLHFAHFAPLENNQIGYFAVYDGPFEKYIQDFAEKLGPIFDSLFKFVIDPPPTPSAKNVDSFIKWAAAHSLAPIGFYAAYPGLRVQDVQVLMADALVTHR